MTDPFAPKRRVVSGGEVDTSIEAVIERLRRCGATDEDLETIRENWPPPADVLAWYRQATDAELVDEITRVQDEWDYGTLSDAELAAKSAPSLSAQAAEQCTFSQAVVEAWVDEQEDSASAALAVLTHESGPEGRQRKGLMASMEAIVNAATS